MKISFLNSALHNNTLNYNTYNNSQNISIYNTKHTSMPRDIVSFRQSSVVPPEVLEYLNTQRESLRRDTIGDISNCLFLYDLEKLEGIQNGIPVFDGLSFKQIVYLKNHLTSILVQRGCNNKCIYCFADAQTPYHMKVNNLSDRIDFENYKNFCDGFKELNKRLKFNIFNPGEDSYKALFHDADCSMIYLEDKNRNTYDYADLAKMLHDATEEMILFDTAGWNLNDKKTQKRMEDLVQKIKTNGNKYKFLKFYISINPFHSIYNRSIELQNEGKAENNNEKIKKAQNLKDIYIDRMANVIFTFSPLIDMENSVTHKCMLDFIFRGLQDYTDLSGYCARDLMYLFNDIVEKVGKMYTDDLTSGKHKIVKNEEQRDKYYYYIKSYVGNRVGTVNLCNEQLINKMDEISAGKRDITINHTFNSATEGRNFQHGLIDINGKFYTTNYVETYPTNITLNYKNKDKVTAPIKPNLNDEIITI